jgi:hypothetical protein
VGQIGGDTGGVDDIVEAEVVDERAGLEEEGEGLSRTCVSKWEMGEGVMNATYLANATRCSGDDCAVVGVSKTTISHPKSLLPRHWRDGGGDAYLLSSLRMWLMVNGNTESRVSLSIRVQCVVMRRLNGDEQ